LVEYRSKGNILQFILKKSHSGMASQREKKANRKR
jgi:hypothetical protein